MGDREHHVLNLGAGVQSTALYLLALDGKLQLDCAIFADTQYEPKNVNKHLEWLQTLGGPPILVRTRGSLGENLLSGTNANGQRFMSIPAFTKNQGGKVGLVRRQCTKEYKIDVCERVIRRELVGLKPRQRFPKGVLVHQYFGISTDEVARAERPKKGFAKKAWTVPHSPLIEMGWSRKDCLNYLADRVPHQVPKSACVFCPYRTNQEWVRMKKESPADFQRAVEVDNGIRKSSRFRQELFVRRSCTPLDEIDFARLAPTTIDPMVVGECQGMCGL